MNLRMELKATKSRISALSELKNEFTLKLKESETQYKLFQSQRSKNSNASDLDVLCGEELISTCFEELIDSQKNEIQNLNILIQDSVFYLGNLNALMMKNAVRAEA